MTATCGGFHKVGNKSLANSLYKKAKIAFCYRHGYPHNDVSREQDVKTQSSIWRRPEIVDKKKWPLFSRAFIKIVEPVSGTAAFGTTYLWTPPSHVNPKWNP